MVTWRGFGAVLHDENPVRGRARRVLVREIASKITLKTACVNGALDSTQSHCELIIKIISGKSQ